eukprot:CAMPEP_0174273952 /NCGR_PEP_ID=MMETSP0439-20130205/56405_1 /TAXON_ID=0 /ORGANISM="Stereomyxa ramosa, Strain Chinc5" /LENGTH=367 /DNA_ID=CAMNT_0015365455 /DNA_START=140 /DNA_END=1243 /DNA_ORIENTATION=-
MIYTGVSGIGYLYLRLFQNKAFEPDLQTRTLYLNTAYNYLSINAGKLQEKYNIDEESEEEEEPPITSFLMGDCGYMALYAVVLFYMGKLDLCKSYVTKVFDYHPAALLEVDNEILYGKAGYLYNILFLKRHLPCEYIPSDADLIASKIINLLFDTGIAYSQEKDHDSPLMYKWFGSEYIGAAHGLSGIVYVLLHFFELLSSQQFSILRDCVDYLISISSSTSSYPTVVGDPMPAKTQWCHGSAGVVYTILKLYEIEPHPSLWTEIENCASAIWKKGLLKKSISICHGATGNAYAFLALYRFTKEKKYLYYAHKFAGWSVTSSDALSVPSPDHPYSLFEGMAGTTALYLDLFDPDSSYFPAFELPNTK